MNIFKPLLIAVCLAGVVLCAGCTPCYMDDSRRWQLPPELKEYKVVALSSSSGAYLYVLIKEKGENRDVIGTSNISGKTKYHIVVIDNQDYEVKAAYDAKEK